MKLRNKKTGRILEAEKILFGNGRIGDALEWNTYQPAVSSLAELIEDWEDYKPAEPLIKGEKVRKAVRAWAEVNLIKNVLYAERSDRSLYTLTDMGDDDFSIELVGWIPTLKDGGEYTIAELCGEEEE